MNLFFFNHVFRMAEIPPLVCSQTVNNLSNKFIQVQPSIFQQLGNNICCQFFGFLHEIVNGAQSRFELRG